MRKFLSISTVLSLLIILGCQQNIEPTKPKALKGFSKTSLANDKLAQSFINLVQAKYFKGNANSARSTTLSSGFGIILTDSLFKYVDTNNDIDNYTFAILDNNPNYFQNLIFSKINGQYYAFVHRFIPSNGAKGIQNFQGGYPTV